MTDKERLALPGLDPRRADLTVAGAVLLDTILQRLGAEDLTLCDLALREGLVLDYIRRHQKEIVHIEQIPDVRRRSVLELAERCNYYADHARHIVQLSLALFDQTRALHGLADREREWLEYAALMHDIGSHISFGRHHRHSYYLITNGDLRGFQPEEIEIMALVARYHRRSTPKTSHEEYARLPANRRAHGPDARRHAAGGRESRPQPRPGHLGPDGAGAEGRRPPRAHRHRRRRARDVGHRAARRAVRGGRRASREAGAGRARPVAVPLGRRGQAPRDARTGGRPEAELAALHEIYIVRNRCEIHGRYGGCMDRTP